MDIVNEYLQSKKRLYRINEYVGRDLANPIVCNDGFTMSVQVSNNHYCSPRSNDASRYSEVEVGFPSKPEELLMSYAEEPDNPTETVYGYVPVEIVVKVIERHGGFCNPETADYMKYMKNYQKLMLKIGNKFGKLRKDK